MLKAFYGIKRFPLFIAERAFWVFVVLICIFAFLGGLIFYQYGAASKEIEAIDAKVILQFDEDTYQKVMELQQEREKEFEQADSKSYLNPFID